MLQVPEARRPQLPVVVPAGELPAAGQPCAAFFLPRAALLARLPYAAVPELPRPPACGPCRQAALTSVCPRALTSIGRGRSRVASQISAANGRQPVVPAGKLPSLVYARVPSLV
mmetsp:Transcript_4878/g.6806  ORF Transcript_4878/g.6806 Transcript_4878/m.6806 type:complete len:114 (-) Transcript_4878:341-682(-)